VCHADNGTHDGGIVGCRGYVGDEATVDFESLPPGTQFGGAPLPNAPGDLVFTENGVGVHVDNFTLGAFVGFNNVEIGGFTDPSFPTTPATINNIRLDFDISGLGPVSGAAFDFVDFGGDENLVINGTVLELPNFSAAPAVVAGVNVSVVPPGVGTPGTVSLAGPLTSLAIGGQELGIDDVRFRVVPEPTTLLLASLAAVACVTAPRRRGE
jgi:hypothetical protein